jgi:glycosyltransferase involved in cell wall biosynthesis
LHVNFACVHHMVSSVSFVLGVLNERDRLPRMLETIRAQRGFSGTVEIIVSDGGSTDGTREIAESFGAVVIDNPLRRCEPGIALGMQAATGDVIVTLAADNPLVGDDFLVQLLEPFDDDSIAAAAPNVVATPEDSWTVRYLNLFTDPLNHFVYWNAASPLTFQRTFPVLKRGDGYVVYEFAPDALPLLALAQGFALRRGFARPEGSEEDDIIPVEALIESGGLVAIVATARIAHHTVAGFRDFLKKFEPRIAARLRSTDLPFWRRHKQSTARRFRRLLWPIYASSVVAPLVVSLYGAVRDRRAEWMMHAPLTVGLVVVFWKQLILWLFDRTKGSRLESA